MLTYSSDWHRFVESNYDTMQAFGTWYVGAYWPGMSAEDVIADTLLYMHSHQVCQNIRVPGQTSNLTRNYLWMVSARTARINNRYGSLPEGFDVPVHDEMPEGLIRRDLAFLIRQWALEMIAPWNNSGWALAHYLCLHLNEGVVIPDTQLELSREVGISHSRCNVLCGSIRRYLQGYESR